MTINKYTSRNIPDPTSYSTVLDTRMEAKAKGDKKTANALKLIVNTTYGGTLQKDNTLYDPLHARSVCISGQLYLIELAHHLYQDVDSLQVLAINTDSITLEFEDSDYSEVTSILDEWQARTGFELEEDKIKLLVQRDINNYLEVMESGEVKVKGGDLVRGISTAGAFKINNNAPIIATAIVKYFTEDIPPEQTIMASEDIFDFQLIAKASHKYDSVIWINNGKKETVQRCNRVYASQDIREGTLFKIKEGKPEKIASLPEHCFIDNANERNINEVDRLWYVKEAYDKINKFKGENKMATTTKKAEEPKTTDEVKKTKAASMPLIKKLVEIRRDFRNTKIEKSGYNQHGGFDYYDLPDIVVPATQILEKYNTMFITNFTDGYALGTLYDLDAENSMVFSFPMRRIEEPAKFRMNEVQSLGAEMTYMRRYLLYLLLDICNKDEFDSAAPPQKTATVEAIKAPAKAEAKKEVANADGKADAIQIKTIKAKLGELSKIDEAFTKKLVNQIKEAGGSDALTKKQAANVLQIIKKQMEAHNAE